MAFPTLKIPSGGLQIRSGAEALQRVISHGPPQYSFFGVAKKGIESPFFFCWFYVYISIVLCVVLSSVQCCPLRCAVLCAVLSSALCCPVCSTVLCGVLWCAAPVLNKKCSTTSCKASSRECVCKHKYVDAETNIMRVCV